MTPSAYAPYEICFWPNATGMVPLRSARGESTPHPALRATFSPRCGEKEKAVRRIQVGCISEASCAVLKTSGLVAI